MGFIAYKYGRRYGFVTLRYIAAVFFFLSQLATFITVSHYIDVAGSIMSDVLESDAVLELFTRLYLDASAFPLGGAWGTFLRVIRSLGNLVIPLYFVATVSFVLNLNRKSIVDVTMRNAALAVLFFVLECIVLVFVSFLVSILVYVLYEALAERFTDIFQLIDSLNELLQFLNIRIYGTEVSTFGSVEEVLQYTAISYAIQKFPSFNVFLDLSLCLSMSVFLIYRPRWARTAKKLTLFRLCALLPILYVCACFVLNGLIRSGTIYVDAEVQMMIPVRSPIFYAFFGCILVCYRSQARTVRHAEDAIGFGRKGKFYGDFAAIEPRAAARARAMRTATFLSVCLFLLCAADLCFSQLAFGAKWGLGKSYTAVFCIPFLFFFDDRKPVGRRQYTAFTFVYLTLCAVIAVLYICKVTT